MAVTLKYYGHSTFGFDTGEHQIILDPFFAPNNPMAQTQG